jgi:hypothetical protein
MGVGQDRNLLVLQRRVVRLAFLFVQHGGKTVEELQR